MLWLLSMNGTCEPTKSLPTSLSSMLIWGSASTVAPTFFFKNCTRISMLIEASSTPLRMLPKAAVTASGLSGRGSVFPPKPFR